MKNDNDDFTSISSVDTCFQNGCQSGSDKFQFWEDDDFGGDNVTGYTIAVQTGELTEQIIEVFESDAFKNHVGMDFESDTINVYNSGSWIPYFFTFLGVFVLCSGGVSFYFLYYKPRRDAAALEEFNEASKQKSQVISGLELG
jgi:hypothetical protein